MQKKELSKHASVIVYLGTHYEDLLETFFSATWSTLLEKMRSVAASIPRDQQLRLKRFNFVRNICAHQKGFQTLNDLPEAIRVINGIEKAFAVLAPQYIPDYVSEQDFQHEPPAQNIVYVEVPSEKAILLQEQVLPPVIRLALWAMGIVLVVTSIFGSLTSKTSSSRVEGFIFKEHYYSSQETPTGFFWLIVIAAGIAVLSGVFHWLSKKPKNNP